jgi:hypothetical protein
MIVNVNPHDTSFEENSHVMKFSAVAKDITTLRQPLAPPAPAPSKMRKESIVIINDDDEEVEIMVEGTSERPIPAMLLPLFVHGGRYLIFGRF